MSVNVSQNSTVQGLVDMQKPPNMISGNMTTGISIVIHFLEYMHNIINAMLR